MSARGYDVAIALNGKFALAALADDRPDLVLVDVMMPVITGVELLRTLKARDAQRAVAVVMMSAASEAALSTEDAALADGWLRKPFTLVELLAAIDHGCRPRAASA